MEDIPPIANLFLGPRDVSVLSMVRVHLKSSVPHIFIFAQIERYHVELGEMSSDITL